MNLNDLLEFFDAPLTIGFDVRPDAAIEFLKAKGLRTSFSYADMMAKEHASAFTVAKMMDTDLLADVKASLEDALESGIPFNTWKQNILPLLQQKGWVGRQAVVDPLTGQTVIAALGTPGRLQTIFRTNLQSAYSVGQWEQIAAQAEEAPFLMYDAIDDYRTRPEHAARDGQVHPITSKFWKTYFPPCGWNCRCSAIQLSQEELDELGLTQSPPAKISTYNWQNPRTGKVEQIPVGVDPGFGFNAGIERMNQLAKLAQEKVAALPADAAAAAMQGLKATTAALDAEAKLLAQQAIQQAQKTGSDLTAASKAGERAAKAQINKALTEKTPYLSKAINELQKTKAGQSMTATELLAAAKEKAGKFEASVNLYEYKKALVAGKTPNAKAKAAFDALPDEAKASVTAEIDAKLAAQNADLKAKAELQDIAAGNQGKVAQTVLASADPALPPTQLVALVKAQTAQINAANNAASAVKNYKKAVLAGKTPTDTQKAAFDALPADKQAKILQEIDAAKVQANAAASPTPQQAVQTPVADFNPDSLTQIGPQKGSNPGGLFQDTQTGTQWYVKFPPLEQARNEILAARLYAAAGIDVPDLRLVTINGQPALASKIIDGLSKGTPTQLAKAAPGYTVDAWLANWDVVGLNYDNLLLRGGVPLRIDVGGSLRFRAQGGLKGAAWGDEVLEIDSLRNPVTNTQSAKVFGKISDADLEDGARKVLAVPEQTIRDLVEEFGPLDAVERKQLLATLLARREDIARRFPNARPAAQKVTAVPTDRVTALEQKEIEASRANGYVLNTDGDAIEDHHVVAMTFTDQNGKAKTRLAFKLRPAAAQKLGGSITPTAGNQLLIVDYGPLEAKAVELAKGINALANKGEPLRLKDKVRYDELSGLIAQAKDKIRANGAGAVYRQEMERILAKYEKLDADFQAYFAKNPIGSPAVKVPIVNGEPELRYFAKAPQAAQTGIAWKEEISFSYQLSSITKGKVVETAKRGSVVGVDKAFYGELPDGSTVRFIPDEVVNSLSARGYVQIDVDGVGIEATKRALALIDNLGVSSARTTAAQQVELYLDRHLYLRAVKDQGIEDEWRNLFKIADQDARIEAKLKMLNREAGFDVTTHPDWNPDGQRQAFGHGRVTLNRADLKADEQLAFEAEHFLFHNPVELGWKDGGPKVLGKFKTLIEVGGQLASQMDRVRRGVQLTGSSVGADFNSGGASYVFTRLAEKKSAPKLGSGFILKPNLTRRLDAFSYADDQFGEVDLGLQRRARRIDLDGMRGNAKMFRNETNFRDSISLLDSIEYVVLENQVQVTDAIKFMVDNGYRTWPDGRALDEVIIPISKVPYKP